MNPTRHAILVKNRWQIYTVPHISKHNWDQIQAKKALNSNLMQTDGRTSSAPGFTIFMFSTFFRSVLSLSSFFFYSSRRTSWYEYWAGTCIESGQDKALKHK